jgi:acylphosphatase
MSEAIESTTLHCWVSGTVHGVFFRDSTRRRALELRLTGWVRNLPDGRVEALFQGSRASCEQALAWVRKGPPSARVTGVEYVWEDAADETAEAFEIRY